MGRHNMSREIDKQSDQCCQTVRGQSRERERERERDAIRKFCNKTYFTWRSEISGLLELLEFLHRLLPQAVAVRIHGLPVDALEVLCLQPPPKCCALHGMHQVLDLRLIQQADELWLQRTCTSRGARMECSCQSNSSRARRQMMDRGHIEA